MEKEPKDGDLITRLRALTKQLPTDLELHRLLLNLEDPANDAHSRDRYTALVASGAVDEGLRVAIQRRRPDQEAPSTFDRRIKAAEYLGVVSAAQAAELHKLRLVRNAFAHSLAPIGFGHPVVVEATRGLWNHPVTDFAGYFAPAFEPRRHFAIVCGEFYRFLVETPQE